MDANPTPSAAERLRSFEALVADHRDGESVHTDAAPKRRQGALRVIARRGRLGHARRPVGVEAGQQNGALHLGAGGRRTVRDRPQSRAANHERRVAVRGVDAGAHLFERLDHATHGSTRQ